MASLNLFQLQCFLIVAEYLNFGKAAGVMHITQPAITHQVRSLEEELGVKLFHRSTHAVSLTAEGTIFLGDARKIVQDVAMAVGRFREKGTPHANIRIACAFPSQVHWIVEPLSSLRDLYPDVHPEIEIIPPPRIADAIVRDQVDLALDLKELHKDTKGLHFPKLADCPIMCVYARHHRLAGRKSVSVEELKQEPVILFRTPYTISDLSQLQWKIGENKKAGDLYPCRSADAAFAMAAAGYGVTVFPDMVIPRSSLLCKIPVSDVPALSFGVFYREISDISRTFIKLVNRTGLTEGKQ